MTDTIIIKSIYCEKCEKLSYFALDLEIVRSEVNNNRLFKRVDIHDDHVLQMEIDSKGDIRTNEYFDLHKDDYEIERIIDINDMIMDQNTIYEKDTSVLFIEKMGKNYGYLSYDIRQGNYKRIRIKKKYILLEYENIDVLRIENLDFLEFIDLPNTYNLIIVKGEFNVLKINYLLEKNSIQPKSILLIKNNSAMLNAAKDKISKRLATEYNLEKCVIKKGNNTLFDVIVDLITIITPKINES